MFKFTELLLIFSIIVLGYTLGRVTVKGLSLGTSGILIVALIFGHFQHIVPGVIKNFGLIVFVTSVGFIAGPVFFKNFKNKATAYIILGITVILLGALTTVTAMKILNVPTPLALGIMNGSLTSTPGLAAALEATGDSLSSIGYGIAYPFGVIGVVLFVQLTPRLVKADMDEEIRILEASIGGSESDVKVKDTSKLIKFDSFGYFAFALIVVLGILFGQIKIPLPGGAEFSFGNSGGPLIIGLIAGYLGRLGPISLEANRKTLESIRELGLCLFLMGTGTDAGAGLVEVLQQQGIKLFIMGMIVTILPLIIGYIFARKVLKLGLLDTLGSITGGMTSTPALGSLVSVAKSDAVAASYAATYPIALIMVVLVSQFTAILF